MVGYADLRCHAKMVVMSSYYAWVYVRDRGTLYAGARPDSGRFCIVYRYVVIMSDRPVVTRIKP